MAILILKDDNEQVNFIYDKDTNPYFSLSDNTFKMSVPEKVEIRVDDNFFAGRNLQRMEYGPRQVTFDARVMGTTEKAVSENVSKIQRLLSRAGSLTYLQGGAYNQNVSMIEGSDTGDHGVILQLKRGDDSHGNITNEMTDNSTALQGLFTMKVIGGDIEVTDNIFGSADRTGKNPNLYYRNCTITLQTEPFILGASRIIMSTATPGFKNSPVTGGSNTVRAFVQAADVPGDVEALTRVGTKLNNAQGIIIARDAGISVLNCPSYPVVSGGKDDIFVYGQILNTGNLALRIQIVAGGGGTNTFRFSNDNGSTWGSTQNVVAWTPISLVPFAGGASGAFVVFGSATGFTTNQYWTFINHQSFVAGASAIDAYDNRNDFMTDSGKAIHSFYVNIPPGCRSRYKMLAYITSDIYCEYRMRVNFIGRASDVSRVATEPQHYEWTGPFLGRMLDLGVIDFTSLSVPFMSHPYAGTVLQVTIYARTMEQILVDPSGSVQFLRGHLVPVQDEFGYMQAGWKTDGSGREVYSNYDAGNPYVAEESVNKFDGDLTGRISMGLDMTYGGNVITLIPNIRQTLMFVPLISVSTDWRASTLGTNGETGDTYLAIRPRYLHLPG